MRYDRDFAPAPAPAHPLDQLLRRAPVGGTADVRAIEAQLPDPLAGVASTYELLWRGSRRDPDAPALTFFLQAGDWRRPFVWTHRHWMQRITQTANLLRRIGIGRGDTVAYVLPNLPETHWVIWGGEAAGRVLALNPLLEAAMLRDLLAAVRPKVVVTLGPTPGTDLWEKVASIAQEVPGLESVLTVSAARYVRGAQGVASRSLARVKRPRHLGRVRVLDLHAQLHGVQADMLEFDPPALDDVASYFCTGGTTGVPKIAVRTHRTEVANAMQVRAMFGAGAGAGEPLFCGLPLFHVNAQVGTGLLPWSAGGHVVLGTPQGYRTPGLLPQFWEIAAHYRLYSFSGVPTVYAALLQSPRQGLDLSCVKFGICGAAPMPFELLERFQRETGIRILEGYGLTEAGCVSTLNPPGAVPVAGSIGVRVPWQELKAVTLDAQGRWLHEAPAGEAGTLAVRGPNLFDGYLDPAHDAWLEEPGTGCRWLNTGDLGRVDAQGRVWLTGRSKELIIRGGHNIDPKMIEEPMHRHPDVALAAAVGRPDAHAGEVPVVYVQLRPGAQAQPGDLEAWAQQHIPERAAWPKAVVCLPALPTTAIGKIFKPALVDLQVQEVVAEEARRLGTPLASCEVVRDPQRGIVVRWRTTGPGSALAERLGAYTFRQERV